jgi:hypothetical protein
MTEDHVEYEIEYCLGCYGVPLVEISTVNLDPAYLTSPQTPINLFVHQDLIKRIHECRGAPDSLQRNLWRTTKLRIPVSLVERLKATEGIEPGPPTTDPEWRLARYEPE